MLNERLGQLNFWLLFAGFNVTFFPMHLAGLWGMPRRVYTYQAGLGWDLVNMISTAGAFLIALSVLAFLANLAWSLRSGAEPGDNPWRADSLEWATPTPVPQYGFRRLPIVRSRHPLWDQEDLREGDPHTVKLLDALAEWPRRYRAQIVTTTLDARPEEVFRVPGPSIWPLGLSIGITGVSVAFIFDSLLWAAVSLVVCVVSLIAWHWPDTIERAGDTAEEDAFEREHGIPVNVQGSVVIARWGMYLAILTLGIALSTLLFCYFYLRLDAPEWPPPGIAQPGATLPAIALALTAAGAAALLWARRGVRPKRGGVPFGPAVGFGLTVGFALVAAAAALGVYELVGAPFSWRAHAYASAYYALAGFHALALLAGAGMAAIALARAMLGRRHARYAQMVENAALFAAYLAVEGALVFGTLYVL
jgi:cytochrome c oxidase subunit I+III